MNRLPIMVVVLAIVVIGAWYLSSRAPMTPPDVDTHTATDRNAAQSTQP